MDRIETLKSIVDAMPMAAMVIGRSSRILALNSGAGALFAPDSLGRRYSMVVRQPPLLSIIENCLAHGATQDVRYLSKSFAQDHVYRARVAPLSGSASAGILVTFEDQSQEEGLDQMRRDFVANVSHELRSPLTSLIGFVDTLKGPAAADPKAQQNFLDMMQVETGRMMRLVQDLLSLSRVEAEQKIMPTDQVDLSPIVAEAIATTAQAAQTKGVAVRSQASTDPIWIAGDAHQLGQVFRNLIENAVNYGDTQVQVTCKVVDHEPYIRGPAVVVDVTDDGQGIAPYHIPRLTERFYRVDPHRSRAAGGTGLGLAIVKHILGRHRGRLRITSTQGQGSRFSAVLPLAEPPEVPGKKC